MVEPQCAVDRQLVSSIHSNEDVGKQLQAILLAYPRLKNVKSQTVWDSILLF